MFRRLWWLIRRPDHQKVLREIEVLERDLGIDSPTLLAKSDERRKDRRWKERGGVVELRPGTKPLVAALQIDPSQFELRPGQRWLVNDPNVVRVAVSSAYSVSATVVDNPYRKRVLLPSGAHAS